MRYQPVLLALALAAFSGCSAESASRDTASRDTTASGPATDTAAARPDAGTPPPASGKMVPLTPDGWGPLRIGMTRAEVVAALGEDANPGAVGGAQPDQCDEFRPARAPAGLLVMLEGGKLSRVSAGKGERIVSERAIAVGDPVAKVLEAYGTAIERTPHKYLSAPAEYLTMWVPGTTGAARRGLVYEADEKGIVTHIRGGGPSIQYVEGCA